MSVFAVSDLHLSLSADKPMDVFKGWENYVSRLEKNWRAVVGEDDTVILPGDISWAMKLEDTFRDFEFINNLPGKKYIIKGNHDYWWTTVAKMNDFLEKSGFNTIGFIHNNSVAVDGIVCCGTRGWLYDTDKMTAADEKILLREAGRLEASLASAGDTDAERVVFLHYPPLFGQTECNIITDLLKKHGIRRCFYGHIHGQGAALAVTGERDGVHYSLVSCDYNGFRPVRIV